MLIKVIGRLAKASMRQNIGDRGEIIEKVAWSFNIWTHLVENARLVMESKLCNKIYPSSKPTEAKTALTIMDD